MLHPAVPALGVYPEETEAASCREPAPSFAPALFLKPGGPLEGWCAGCSSAVEILPPATVWLDLRGLHQEITQTEMVLPVGGSKKAELYERGQAGEAAGGGGRGGRDGESGQEDR